MARIFNSPITAPERWIRDFLYGETCCQRFDKSIGSATVHTMKLQNQTFGGRIKLTDSDYQHSAGEIGFGKSLVNLKHAMTNDVLFIIQGLFIGAIDKESLKGKVDISTPIHFHATDTSGRAAL